jgi:hypothetical protein
MAEGQEQGLRARRLYVVQGGFCCYAGVVGIVSRRVDHAGLIRVEIKLDFTNKVCLSSRSQMSANSMAANSIDKVRCTVHLQRISLNASYDCAIPLNSALAAVKAMP